MWKNNCSLILQRKKIHVLLFWAVALSLAILRLSSEVIVGFVHQRVGHHQKYFPRVVGTMQTMNYIFMVLLVIGLWRPVHWRPGWKTFIYNSYGCFLMFVMIIGIISQFIAWMMSIDNIEEFASNSFTLLTMMLDYGKGLNILTRRGKIIKLTNILQQNPFAPRSEKEYAIQRKFDQSVRFVTLCYGSLVCSCLTIVTLRSLVHDLPRRALPYQAWFPFEFYESLMGYSFAYTSEIMTISTGSIIGIAFDSLLPALMLQTCAQLNILKHRFHEMSPLLPDDATICEKTQLNLSTSISESKLLSKCVRHHIDIFKFAKSSNDIFSIMIFLQCVVSTAVLCLCLFQLSKLKISSTEFSSLFSYMVVMSVQIFIYCFYGCRVTLESLALGDAIYEIDWPSLSLPTQRSLLTIMARTLIPIQFISGHVVTLNLESFNSLIKLSYSTYNVLKQTRE